MDERSSIPSSDGALDSRSLALRRLVIRGLAGGGRGHIGSSMSLIEILRVLYDDVIRFRADEPGWSGRDRCILSKGHGCLAQYALLADKGFFPVEALDTFCNFGGMLGGHPEAPMIPGVEASTGSLGHGLAIGVGMAMAARLGARNHRVFVIMGDGEMDEGSVWEAALIAGKRELSNLVVLVDFNKMQSYGPVSDVQPLEPLPDKWRAFGFGAVEVDGHDVPALQRVVGGPPPAPGRPTAVICHTVKGRGLPFAEGDPTWHHKNRLGPDEIGTMLAALEAEV
jgi:transketolase